MIWLFVFVLFGYLIAFFVISHQMANNENCYLRYKVPVKVRHYFLIFSDKEEICILSLINQAIGFILTLVSAVFLILGLYEKYGIIHDLMGIHMYYLLVSYAINCVLYHFFS